MGEELIMKQLIRDKEIANKIKVVINNNILNLRFKNKIVWNHLGF